jgi:hypothetical protein
VAHCCCTADRGKNVADMQKQKQNDKFFTSLPPEIQSIFHEADKVAVLFLCFVRLPFTAPCPTG